MNRLLLCLPALGLTGFILVYLTLAQLPADTGPAVEDPRGPDLPAAGELATPAQMERLARDNPLAFLENCLLRYRREVKGYRMVMWKQERIGGSVKAAEVIDVAVREEPYSVFMQWREGARNAERVLWVKGENEDQLLARPNGAILRALAGRDIVDKPVDGPEAKQSGRYPINKFGIRKTTERTYDAWKEARDQGELRVEYRGEQVIPEAGDRRCYCFYRSCVRPEADGVLEQTILVDKETWLQVGTIVKGEGSRMIGTYYYRGIQLNPDFPPTQFQRAALMP
jgi:uncharacterized protein DUF1571